MHIFMMGGWMMWPLALVSVTAAAIVIERVLLFSSFSFPTKKFREELRNALNGDASPLIRELEKTAMLQHFASLLQNIPPFEAALRIEGEAIVKRLEARLSMLSLLARLAPLMGLLGTIWGMLSTFSEIANAQAGVNMNQLAGGIWQSLITTAAGLCIAIPSLFFLHIFRTRVHAAADALSEAANAVLSLQKERQ